MGGGGFGGGGSSMNMDVANEHIGSIIGELQGFVMLFFFNGVQSDSYHDEISCLNEQ